MMTDKADAETPKLSAVGPPSSYQRSEDSENVMSPRLVPGTNSVYEDVVQQLLRRWDLANANANVDFPTNGAREPVMPRKCSGKSLSHSTPYLPQHGCKKDKRTRIHITYTPHVSLAGL